MRRLTGGLAALLLAMTTVPAAAAGVAVAPVGVPAPTFTNYYAPPGFTAPRVSANCTTGALNCDLTGEPSIGVDYATGKVMMQQWLTTARLSFNDRQSPPGITWEDVSSPLTQQASLDAILFTDNQTKRTFTSQLAASGGSITVFSDDDGQTWLPSQGGGQPAGPDHQTIGGGPYPAAVSPLSAAYPHVFYYCSQGVAAEICAPSFDGGVTYQNSQKIFDASQCLPGLHGHVKVAPNGTAYVPIKACDEAQLAADTASGLIYPGKKGVAISRNAGLTPWDFNTIPDSYTKVGTIGHDPSIGIGAHNTVYYGYTDARGYDTSPPDPNATTVAKVAVSHDDGRTWSESTALRPQLGLKNVDFPVVVAGDDNRAAFAFLGTTTAGHTDIDETASDPKTVFKGVWYLYVGMTYDGGKTWKVVNATPGDPVQRGCIAPGSATNCRNMLDFNDITVDRQGRVLVAYTDGCHAACENDPANDITKRSRWASVVRQTCGLGLYAAYDSTLSGGCFTAASNSFVPGRATSAAGGALPNTATAPVRGAVRWVAFGTIAMAVAGMTFGAARRRRRPV